MLGEHSATEPDVVCQRDSTSNQLKVLLLSLGKLLAFIPTRGTNSLEDWHPAPQTSGDMKMESRTFQKDPEPPSQE